ncbi:phosphatidylglycerophosphatase A [Histophilus somni]|nr:phosphatidylglycerophosphatase A [Histophilus somni]QQF66648.1 phosphatidylglycerophosphatase A [Histophilus somni]QQF71401.1 phosphatidylglycerophosphatase A [Histophilus somni]QQF73302.1 phosphatidylglycerophosphatase A [Histophilus somni]QQF79715.1 phosphatidylglycerophosphatase A [Histophilus somni]QQF81460.1 phosphatidylglycerophosphatase A [Histophilus somni]
MMTNNPLSRISLTNPIHFFALGLGSGLIHPAPGTWGTLAGLIVGCLLLQIMSVFSFAIFTALCFLLGCYLCQQTADDMGVHDHGSIVWDEFVGIFTVLLSIPELSLIWCSIAFVVFRIFDILKPYPIRYFDHRLESGFGIMLDDVLAAIYTVISISILNDLV